jgi:hypothetical protein
MLTGKQVLPIIILMQHVPDENTDHERSKPEHSGSYYYDDAHGYQDYDPESDDELDENDGSVGADGDVDGDVSPAALVESNEAKKETCDVAGEDREPNVDGL